MIYDEFIDVLTEGCENGQAIEIKLILQIMKLANAREPGNHGGWIYPISRPRLAELVGCEEQNLRCQWTRLFGGGTLLDYMEGTAAVEQGIVRKAPANTVVCRVQLERSGEWIRERRAAKQEAKREAARKRAEMEAAAAAAAAELEENPTLPRARTVRRCLLSRPVYVGPKKPMQLNDEQQDALACCTRVKFKSEGQLRDFTVVEGAETMLIFDFVPVSNEAKSEDKANKGASILAPPTSHAQSEIDALSAALVTRGIAVGRRKLAIIQLGMPGVPLPFFLQVLDDKIAKAKSQRKQYNPAWLRTTAEDAAEAWAERQRVAQPKAAAPSAKAAPVCKKCNGLGLLDWTPVDGCVPEMVEAVRNGVSCCDCEAGETTRDLIKAYSGRSSS